MTPTKPNIIASLPNPVRGGAEAPAREASGVPKSSRRRFLARFTGPAGPVGPAIVVASAAVPRVAGETFLKSKDRTEVLTQCSATRLAEMIRARKVSSSEVVRAYIDRIEAVNPQLNAVVTKSYDLALKEAKEADEVLARGGACGPLHGVPMTIKDSLDTAGVRSTWGTLGRFNTIPARDATAVGRARAAGAILMGKTNTPEFTIGSGSYSIGTTMNLVFGLTRNPYDTRRSCAGSSGGAGSIVGAYGSGFDIGSDFGGSIRSPSHHNGVAGVKPTSGRVPRTGHAVDYGGIYDNQQQIGPMARRVEDLILITPIIAGPDDLDASIVPAPFRSAGDVDLKTLRVAFFSDVGGYHQPTPETVSTVHAAAKALEPACRSVAESAPDGYREFWPMYSKLRFADSSQWIRRLAEKVGTKFPAAGRKFDGPLMPVAELSELVEFRDQLKSRALAWFRDYDVLVCPTNSSPARLIGEDAPASAGYTTIYNLTGWPAVVVRCGSAEGLPIGLQVVARPFREDVAFAVAEHLELVFGGWKPPAI
jgi:amidase